MLRDCQLSILKLTEKWCGCTTFLKLKALILRNHRFRLIPKLPSLVLKTNTVPDGTLSGQFRTQTYYYWNVHF
jgi:hypothetical protein